MFDINKLSEMLRTMFDINKLSEMLRTTIA